MDSNGGVEKTEEDLRREIDELLRQQRQINERLRDPRGLRRGGASAGGPRNFAANGGRHRGFVRPPDRNEAEDQPPAKRRLLSAVVKVEDGEIALDPGTGNDAKKKEVGDEGSAVADNVNLNDGSQRPSNLQKSGWSRRDGNKRAAKIEVETLVDEHVPRVLPKNEDPSMVSRNKRMLGQLLGTLEKFRNEDMKLTGTEAYIQRSNALQRAEQRAREESERLRQQEREQIAEKRKRDLILRARVAAKAEEKRLELLFLRWSEHHKKLTGFIRLFLTLVQKCPY
uniref:Pinin/SDK/MemA protein domain-containing protein n=1 Tax=Rhizophora mucronata TaxID=61149 RepID=A0A2P2L956_RHIMU